MTRTSERRGLRLCARDGAITWGDLVNLVAVACLFVLGAGYYRIADEAGGSAVVHIRDTQWGQLLMLPVLAVVLALFIVRFRRVHRAFKAGNEENPNGDE